MKDKHFSVKSISRKWACLKSFVSYCVSENGLDESDLLFIPRVEIPSRLCKVIDRDSVEKILCSIDVSTWKGLRNYVLIELLYSTGVRVSECVSIMWKDICFNERRLLVYGKGGKSRYIPLTVCLNNDLLRFLNVSEMGCDKVFCTSKGKPLTRNGVYSIIKGCSKGIIDVSPHSFRHAFATHLIEGDAPLRDVQLLLGHKSLISTQVYLDVSSSFLKKTYRQAHPRAIK